MEMDAKSLQTNLTKLLKMMRGAEEKIENDEWMATNTIGVRVCVRVSCVTTLAHMDVVLRTLAPLGKCRACNERVFWFTMNSGAKNPIQADGLSHFATCTDAKRFRRGK